ncbi:hypothetical protein OSI72_25260, partial [Mycobacterium ulcerans]
AALHPLLALTQPPTNDTDDTNTADTGDQVRLPYAFTGISLHATHATRLRVRLTRTGADAITVHTSDTTGAPVAIIDSLITRPLTTATGSAPATTAAGLLHLSWPPHPDTTTDTDTDTDALRYRVIAEPTQQLPRYLHDLHTSTDLHTS